jgi:hypothetical protein
VLFVGTTSSVLHAADDAYLQLLDEEVTKVEAVSTDKEGDDAGRSAEDGAMGRTQTAPSRERFESLLRKQHVGTYSFYRRLPERSREEIFIDYANGASMETVREKVVDRFLHP